MAERCGPLCQHPGCWHAGRKAEAYRKRNSGYLKFINELLSKHSNPSSHEKTVSKECDGLPVVTVFDAAEQAAFEHPSPQRSRNLPPLHRLSNKHDGNHQSHLNRSYSSDLDTVQRSTFTVRGEGNNALQGCNYIQLVLEEVPNNRVDGQAEAGDDELKFTPVLVWKPAAVCQQDMKQFETPFECKSSRNGKRKERKVAMGTTDLTESLPSELVANNEVKYRYHTQQCLRNRREGAKGKKMSSRGQRNMTCSCEHKHPLEQILMEDLSDMPTYIVKQILQHLRSESDASDNIESPPPMSEPAQSRGPPSLTPSPLTPPPPHIPLPVRPPDSKIPSSILLNLSTSTVHRPAPQYHVHSPTVEKTKGSFSRRLASNPEEAMQNMKIKRSPPLCHRTVFPRALSTRHSTFSEATTVSALPPKTPPTQRSSGLKGVGDITLTLTPPLPQESTSPRHPPLTSTHLKRQQATMENMKQHSTTHDCRDQSWLSCTAISTSQPHTNYFSVHLPSYQIDELPTSPPTQPHNEDIPVLASESPCSGIHSSLSHHSSDHLIASADIATETGELLLLDRSGRVIHHVKARQKLEDYYRAQNTSTPDMGLEDGSIAPPPTARDVTNLEQVMIKNEHLNHCN